MGRGSQQCEILTVKHLKWLSEIRATRRSLAEIGLLIIIREIFKNNLEMSLEDADETLGSGWMGTAKRLSNAGMITVTHDGLHIRMRVDAPGDRKRERTRRLMARLRAMRRLEECFKVEAKSAKARPATPKTQRL
jgi:hypothetical protein